MINLRTLIIQAVRDRTALKIRIPLTVQKMFHHDEGPPQPFDNMPFKIRNRYFATVFFVIFFGMGLWAPYGILWYSMAKKTL